MGEQYLYLGERERARRVLLEAKALAHDIGAERFEYQNDALLAYLDARPDRLRDLAAKARTSNDTWTELLARYWLARLLVSTDSPDARDALERALSLARELKVRTMTDDCTRALAKLAHSAA
jgi:hypothetical protein